MGSVKETTNLTRTTNQVGIREDAFLNSDHLKGHKFCLLVVHANHVVELSRCRVQSDTHRNNNRAHTCHVGVLLKSDALQDIPSHFNVYVVSIRGAVARCNKVRVLVINVLNKQHTCVVRHINATRKSKQLTSIPLRPQPAHGTAVRKQGIRWLHVTREDIRRRIRFKRMPDLPRGAFLLIIPTNNHRTHAVSDLVAATLLHFHGHAVQLPPTTHSAGSISSVTVMLTHTRLSRSKVHSRNNRGDTASHLINTRRQKVRRRRHRVLLHVRQRNFHRPVINRLDHLHACLKRPIIVQALTVNTKDVLNRFHAIPLLLLPSHDGRLN